MQKKKRFIEHLGNNFQLNQGEELSNWGFPDRYDNIEPISPKETVNEIKTNTYLKKAPDIDSILEEILKQFPKKASVKIMPNSDSDIFQGCGK